MNIVSISGNLGKDVELRHLPDGTPVASFSVADSQGRDKPSIWWNCALFGKRAEALSPYLLKGTQVTVNGAVTEREFTDKDGNKRSTLKLYAQSIVGHGKWQKADKPVDKPVDKSNPYTQMEDDVPF